MQPKTGHGTLRGLRFRIDRNGRHRGSGARRFPLIAIDWRRCCWHLYRNTNTPTTGIHKSQATCCIAKHHLCQRRCGGHFQVGLKSLFFWAGCRCLRKTSVCKSLDARTRLQRFMMSPFGATVPEPSQLSQPSPDHCWHLRAMEADLDFRRLRLTAPPLWGPI